MQHFSTRRLAPNPDEIAPDGSEVRLLVRNETGSVAHFSLPPGAVSVAVQHRTVNEYWFVLAGAGRIWRQNAISAEITDIAPGTSLSLPLGTAFQFRNDGPIPLEIIGFDSPPWPGDGEAFVVKGEWEPTV